MFTLKLATGETFFVNAAEQLRSQFDGGTQSRLALRVEATPADHDLDWYLENLDAPGALDTVQVLCENGSVDCLQRFLVFRAKLQLPFLLDSVYTRQRNCDRMEASKKTGEGKMDASYHRHDISDQVWSLLEPHLPGQRGQWGGIAQDNRRFINAVFWVLRTGAPWRDLPPDYGKWGSVHQRFIRWRRKGVWEKLLEILIDEPDYEWLMIDASHIKVHPQAAGAKGGNQDMSRTKGGSTPKYIWPWMRMVCQSESLLQKVPERIVKKLST